MSGKKLNKRTLTLIIGFAVIVLLGGALAALLLTGGDESAASSSPASSLLPGLITKKLDDVKNVEVTNTSGSYTLVKSGDDYTLSSFTAPGTTEVKTVPTTAKFKSATIKSFINDLVGITPASVVADAEKNLSLYGLDKPAAKFKLNFTDGTSFSFDVGNKAPDNSNYYVYDPQGKQVCLISQTTLSYVDFSKEDYTENTLVPQFEQDKIPAITGFTFGGTVRAEPIVIAQKPKDNTSSGSALVDSGFKIVSPKQKLMSTTPLDNISKVLWGTAASSTYAVAPTPEQLTETGLDTPYSTMQLTYDGGQVELKLGKKTDAGYYCQTSLNDAIFVVAPENVPWAEYQLFDLYDKFAMISNINDVSAVTIEVGGKAYRFEVGHGEENKILAKYEGKDMDEEVFKPLYQLMISAIGENPVTEQPTSATVMKFTYEYTDKSRSINTVEFKPVSDRQIAMVVNGGEADFLIRSKYIDKVKTSIDQVLKGEKISTTW